MRLFLASTGNKRILKRSAMFFVSLAHLSRNIGYVPPAQVCFCWNVNIFWLGIPRKKCVILALDLGHDHIQPIFRNLPSHTPSMMNPSIGLRRACRQELYSGEAGALMMLGPLAMDFECFLVWIQAAGALLCESGRTQRSSKRWCEQYGDGQ